MATRSFIGMKGPDGVMRRIYVHFDGHYSHHGPILVGHYDTEEKVRALLDLGDLSVLGPELGEKHDGRAIPRTAPDAWCVAYARDMGEDHEKTKAQEGLGADYVFENGEWWLYGVRLADKLKERAQFVARMEAAGLEHGLN